MRQFGVTVSAFALLLISGVSAILCTSCEQDDQTGQTIAGGGNGVVENDNPIPPPEAELAINLDWYIADAMLSDAELAPTNAATVRGLTISNQNDSNVTLDSITLIPRFSEGFEGEGVEFLVFHDADSDGNLQGHYREALISESIPESFTEHRLSDLQPLSSTMLVDLNALGNTPEIPAGGSLSVGFFVWNNNRIDGHVYFDVDEVLGKSRVPDQDGDGVEEEVPVKGDNTPVPPSDPPTFFGENGCKVKLLCDPVWKLCHVPDLLWTDTNEFALSNGCTPYKTEITFTARASDGGNPEGPAKLRLLSTIVFDNNIATKDVVKVEEIDSETCVDMIKATITPIEGKHSSACESTIVAGYATVCCPDGKTEIKLDDSKESGPAGCKGTSIVVKLFPVVCCNTECNNKMVGTPPDAAVQMIVKGKPPGEDAGLSPTADCNGSTRVDPRSIFDDQTMAPDGMQQGGKNGNAIMAAVTALAAGGTPSHGVNAANATTCMTTACMGLCVSVSSGGAVSHGTSYFKYQFLPEACGEKIMLSQFAADGSAGTVGIEQRDEYVPSGSAFAGTPTSNMRHNQMTDTDPQGNVTTSLGRDFESSGNDGFISFRPTESAAPDSASETGSYPCSYIIVSACSRPVTALRICPMEELKLKIKVHYPEKNGAGNMRAADFGDDLQTELQSRLGELFAQACIKIVVETPTSYANTTNADAASNADVLSTFNGLSAAVQGPSSTLNIVLVNTMANGAVAAHVPNSYTDDNGVTVQGSVVALPIEFGGTPGDGIDGPDDFIKGRNLLCSQVPAHEVGHALGLAEGNMHPSGDTQPKPIVDGDRRIMATGGGDELAKQPRYCWPTFLRFSCQTTGTNNDQNEVMTMRKKLKGGVAFHKEN